MKSHEQSSSLRAAQGQVRATFLKRLERLIQLRRAYRDDLNSVGVQLMDRAIYATYRDCIEFGGGEKARVLMAGQPLPQYD